MGKNFRDIDDFEVFEGEVREAYGRCAYTHKTHEKSADIYTRQDRYLKTTQLALSALTSAGLVTVLFDDNQAAEYFSAVTAFLLLFLNTYSKNLKHGELAIEHRAVAAKIWTVREKYLALLIDLKLSNRDLSSCQERRCNLIYELSDIYKNAPRTSNLAYVKAQKALKINEELTFSDDEIDNLLPSTLRKGK